MTGFDSFFDAMEKNAGIGSKVVKSIVNMPLGLALAAGGLAFAVPAIINESLKLRVIGGVDNAQHSLQNLEETNKEMVATLQRMAPVAKPKRDTYPYV